MTACPNELCSVQPDQPAVRLGLAAGHALADLLAVALAHDAVHLALAACELLRLAYVVAVGVAEAHAFEGMALRQAERLFHHHPAHRPLCTYSFVTSTGNLLTHHTKNCDDEDHLPPRGREGRRRRMVRRPYGETTEPSLSLSFLFCRPHGGVVSYGSGCNRRSYREEQYMEADMMTG